MKEKIITGFGKRRLHSSVELHLRRTGIPSNMLGYDLLRGVIYGMIRNPEITVEEAVQNAIDASVFGGNMTIKYGYNCIFESLETVIDIDEINSKETIQQIVQNFITEIRKEYCYEITIKAMDFKFPKWREYVGGELIKCMVFKKTYAPESTFDCMFKYAVEKTEKFTGEKVRDNIKEYLNPFLSGYNSIEELVDDICSITSKEKN